jgi:hypothetical protein
VISTQGTSAPLTLEGPPCGARLLAQFHGPHPGHLARPPSGTPAATTPQDLAGDLEPLLDQRCDPGQCPPLALPPGTPSAPPVEGPQALAPDQRSRRRRAPRPGPQAPAQRHHAWPGAADPPPAASPRARVRDPHRPYPPLRRSLAACSRRRSSSTGSSNRRVRFPMHPLCRTYTSRQTGRQRSVPAAISSTAGCVSCGEAGRRAGPAATAGSSAAACSTWTFQLHLLTILSRKYRIEN